MFFAGRLPDDVVVAGQYFADDARALFFGFQHNHHFVAYGDGVGEAVVGLPEFTPDAAGHHRAVGQHHVVPAPC